MEWQKQVQRWQQQNGSENGEMMYVKVMTDEQLETLRKQIAVYATICEQLIEMHRTLSAQQDLAGGSLSLVFTLTLYLKAWLFMADHVYMSKIMSFVKISMYIFRKMQKTSFNFEAIGFALSVPFISSEMCIM